MRTLDRAMALADAWDADIPVGELLDRAEAIQSLKAQDRLEIVIGALSLFKDPAMAEAGIKELFRLSLGVLADLEKG